MYLDAIDTSSSSSSPLDFVSQNCFTSSLMGRVRESGCTTTSAVHVLFLQWLSSHLHCVVQGTYLIAKLKQRVVLQSSPQTQKSSGSLSLLLTSPKTSMSTAGSSFCLQHLEGLHLHFPGVQVWSSFLQTHLLVLQAPVQEQNTVVLVCGSSLTSSYLDPSLDRCTPPHPGPRLNRHYHK